MVSQELGVSLGIGLTLAVVFEVLLCRACKQQFAPRLQADPESGHGRSGVRSSGGPSGFPNHISHTLSRQPRPRASTLVYNVEGRHTVLGSRQPLTEINVTQSHHSQERSQIPPGEVQSVPSTSRRTRPRRQTHPSAYVSGQELRATERTDIPTNDPQNPHTEPTIDTVEEGLFDPIAPAYVQELPPLLSEDGTPTSTSSTDSDSDPRLSPVRPPTPEPTPGRRTRSDDRSPHEISIPPVSQTNEARNRQWRLRQSRNSISNDIDDIPPEWHEPSTTLHQSESSSDPPPPPRRQRRATDNSNRPRSAIRPRSRSQTSGIFDDDCERIFIVPPAAVAVPTASTNAGRSYRRGDERPMPGSWPASPTASPPLSEDEIRLRDITVRNTAANMVRMPVPRDRTQI